MKMAICISGQIRENFSKFIENLQEFVINNYNCDIFMCTDYSCKEKLSNKNIFTDIKFIDFNDDLYKKYKLGSLSLGHSSYFYKIYKCNKLLQKYKKKYNIKYDLVLHLRPDLIINEKLNFEKIDKNTIYGPLPSEKNIKNMIYFILLYSVFDITDQIFYGNYNSMKRLCNFYKNGNMDHKYMFINSPEIMINNILKKTLKFKKVYSVNYTIITKKLKNIYQWGNECLPLLIFLLQKIGNINHWANEYFPLLITLVKKLEISIKQNYILILKKNLLQMKYTY